MPNHKSQRGFYIMVGDGAIMDDHNKLYPCMLLSWSSGRIGLAVRSALSAEAYSCSEAQDVAFWTRAVCADIFPANKLGHECRQAAEEWKGVLVTDCRSLWNCVVKER
eukprot:4086414-Pyramimonas_sp.AAC.1